MAIIGILHYRARVFHDIIQSMMQYHNKSYQVYLLKKELLEIVVEGKEGPGIRNTII